MQCLIIARGAFTKPNFTEGDEATIQGTCRINTETLLAVWYLYFETAVSSNKHMLFGMHYTRERDRSWTLLLFHRHSIA